MGFLSSMSSNREVGNILLWQQLEGVWRCYSCDIRWHDWYLRWLDEYTLSLSSCVLSPYVKHKHWCDEDETHYKNWDGTYFKTWWIFSVESPHATTPTSTTTTCYWSACSSSAACAFSLSDLTAPWGPSCRYLLWWRRAAPSNRCWWCRWNRLKNKTQSKLYF